MNNRQLVLMSVCALLGFSACSEKKQTKDIIVPKVVKKVQKKINTIPREKNINQNFSAEFVSGYFDKLIEENENKM